jgi:hypothetical protein
MLARAGVPRIVGALLAGVYLVLVGWAFAKAWFNSNIQHAGYVWIPFIFLTMPWSGFNHSIMTNVSPVAVPWHSHQCWNPLSARMVDQHGMARP